LLQAYARLLGDAVDTAVAFARADGARRALGLLGHELSTPLARLGSTAETALREIHADLVSYEASERAGDRVAGVERLDHARAASAGYLQQIRLERRSVGAAMRLAPIVAQETDGRLEVQFEEFDLGKLIMQSVRDASDEANDDPANTDAQGSGGRRRWFRFETAGTARRLGPIVGDAGLLSVALTNILRNAAKYSISDRPEAPCVIEVAGLLQRTMAIVVVRNVGHPIDREQMDIIFEPWVRLGDTDGRVARRGMGLGLFLSRRIAMAHRGTVLCRDSTEVESGPRGRPLLASDESVRAWESMVAKSGAPKRRLPGARPGVVAGPGLRGPESPRRFATEFELRVERGLPVGAHVHEWRHAAAVGAVRIRGG